MSYTWTGVDDFYFGKWYLFTGDEIELAEILKNMLGRKEISHSQKELFEIFPESKDILKEQLKTLKPLLEEKNNEIRVAVVKKEEAGRSELWFFEMCLENRQQEYKELEKKIRRIEFVLHPPVKDNPDTITQNDIDRAKVVPLTDFIEINSAGFAKCPFHEEKSGSFKYYSKQNRYHCFGCTAGGDVIDFISRQKSCGFLEAVRFLLRK